MFGIGETELVLIVLFAFMIFGPDKLPGMGRTIGRALRQFKNAQEGFTEVVQTNIVDPAAEALSDSPKKPNRKREEELAEDEAEAAAAADEDADADKSDETADAPKTSGKPDTATGEAAVDSQPKPKPSAADLYAMGTSAATKRAGGDAGVSPSATHEVSEERSDERRADGVLPDGAGADDATDAEKEA